MKIVAFCDGSCKPNPGLGGVGWLILVDDQLVAEGDFFLGPSTNNIAEISALEQVLVYIKSRGWEDKEIEISTDSQYVIGLFSKNWKAKANQDLVAKVRKELEDFPNLTLSWVRGHNGNNYNERVDYLASQIIDKNREK